MLLDLGLQTEGKFQKVLEASQYPKKSKGQASGKEAQWKNGKTPFPGSKKNKYTSNPAVFSTHGPKLPDWQGIEIQGPSGFWALMGREANSLGESKIAKWS